MIYRDQGNFEFKMMVLLWFKKDVIFRERQRVQAAHPSRFFFLILLAGCSCSLVSVGRTFSSVWLKVLQQGSRLRCDAKCVSMDEITAKQSIIQVLQVSKALSPTEKAPRELERCTRRVAHSARAVFRRETIKDNNTNIAHWERLYCYRLSTLRSSSCLSLIG